MEDLLHHVIVLLIKLCLVLPDLHVVITLRVTPHPLQCKWFSTYLAKGLTAVSRVVAELEILELLRVVFHVLGKLILVNGVRFANKAMPTSHDLFQMLDPVHN